MVTEKNLINEWNHRVARAYQNAREMRQQQEDTELEQFRHKLHKDALIRCLGDDQFRKRLKLGINFWNK